MKKAPSIIMKDLFVPIIKNAIYEIVLGILNYIFFGDIKGYRRRYFL